MIYTLIYQLVFDHLERAWSPNYITNICYKILKQKHIRVNRWITRKLDNSKLKVRVEELLKKIGE